jgi:hypothetical protein
MGLHYDEKGKFYTDYVSKDAVTAVIQTTTQRIQGSLYLRAGERVSDMLNRSEHFLAVTDATVFDAEGKEIYNCGFMAVNIDLIVWLVPKEENNEVSGAGGVS